MTPHAAMSPTPAEFRELRLRAGLTQTQVAEILHVHPQTVVRWEAGDREIHAAFWDLMRLRLGVPTDILTEENGNGN